MSDNPTTLSPYQEMMDDAVECRKDIVNFLHRGTPLVVTVELLGYWADFLMVVGRPNAAIQQDLQKIAPWLLRSKIALVINCTRQDFAKTTRESIKKFRKISSDALGKYLEYSVDASDDDRKCAAFRAARGHAIRRLLEHSQPAEIVAELHVLFETYQFEITPNDMVEIMNQSKEVVCNRILTSGNDCIEAIDILIESIQTPFS